jgi:hypothetical protein
MFNSSFDPQQILSLQTLYQILIGSAFVTMVINVTWFLISSGVNFVVRRARLRIKRHDFVLGKAITREAYENLSRDISGFYCLLVRYGIDEYMSRLANDQERVDGRQQLRIFKVSVKIDSKNMAIFGLRLPIHQRLGTQFKCFVVGRSEDRIPAIIDILKKCEHVSDVKQSDSYYRDRVYFLLDQFAIVDTITSGVRNNYIFPE